MTESLVERRRIRRGEFWWIGDFAGLFVLAGTCAIACVVWVFIVPKFAEIFEDALPGRPLPLITQILIAHHLLFALAALAWPIVGLVLYRKQNHYSAYWIIGGIGLFVLLVGLTAYAMFAPMVELGGITGRA